MPGEDLDALQPPAGWTIARRDADLRAVFLRRKQRLTRQAVRDLITEAIVFAHQTGGRFQSWLHEPFL